MDGEEVQVTSGCNMAFVATVLALADVGERILMTRPCYFNHESTLQMLGLSIDYVDLDPASGLQLDLPSLAAALTPETRALALVSPNNPTGVVYTPEALEAVFDLCRDRGVWLILDETYRDFLPPQGSGSARPISFRFWRLRRSNWTYRSIVRL